MSNTGEARVILNEFRGAISRVGVLLLIIVAYVSCDGCGVATWIEINPSTMDQKLIIFDRYEVRPDLSWGVRLYPSFFPALRSTASLDTIPVLTIDSVRCRGNCLSSPYGGPVISLYQYSLENSRSGHGQFVGMRYNPDIDSGSGWYYLDDFLQAHPDTVSIDLCDKQEITVTVYARLNDRKTFALIAADSASCKYRVKKISQFRIKVMH